MLYFALPPATIDSPPHAWGNRVNARTRARRDRFTPTRVGTSAEWFFDMLSIDGSPPHAWGDWRRYEYRAMYLRFTPTLVGTSYCLVPGGNLWPVHPHTRGDII